MTENLTLKEQKIRQFRKGILELAVLKIISEQECYGYHIVDSLKKNSVMISEGTIYPILSRLKEEQAISYRWEESTRGPPRKYYLLTEKGKELLDLLIAEWRSINQGLDRILGEKK